MQRFRVLAIFLLLALAAAVPAQGQQWPASPITIISDAKAKLEVVRVASNKLTPEEREVLGL